MKAFHNDPAIKQKYLDRVIRHQKMDNLIRGTGWEDGKGCAVGCTLEKYDHSAYETELGIPEWLAKLEDTLFEGMSLEKSKTWPEKFLEAVQPGTDLNQIKTPFLVVILKHTLASLEKVKFDAGEWSEVKDAIEQTKSAIQETIRCHEAGEDLKSAESVADSARSAALSAAWSAWSAADSARSAAESAAWSAESAAWSAESAALSAAWSAESVADSARSAALSAAWSAASAAFSAAWSAASAALSAESAANSARSAADSAARSAADSAKVEQSGAFDYYADELLKLMRELKP